MLIAVSEDMARARAEAACRLAGTVARRIARPAPGNELLRQADGLIWDGVPFDSTGRMLRVLRRAHPDLAIVLHPPAQPGLEAVAAATAAIPRAAVYAQWGERSDVVQLGRMLERQLTTAPERVVEIALQQLLANAPARPLAFATTVLHARAVGRSCTVAGVARALGAGADRLRRRWPARLFPKPKQLLDAVTMLYTSYVRAWSGAGWSAVARASGLEPEALRRIRNRWFPLGTGPPVFDQVFLKVAARLAVPCDRARQVLEDLSLSTAGKRADHRATAAFPVWCSRRSPMLEELPMPPIAREVAGEEWR